MKAILAFFFLPVFAMTCSSQQLVTVIPLQSELAESSGLLYLDGALITHNDSGGAPELHEIDTLTGAISRTVVVENATNVDWEDLCSDDDYIYIGDFGNNAGTRTDLKIYRIAVPDYLNTPNDTVMADTIHFEYADQTDFSVNTFATNFDAEAIISFEDSLYIFTKNWGNSKTNIYPLSKSPGSYACSIKDSIDAQGLITGAHFNSLTNEIILSGYTFSAAFFITINGFVSNDFSQGTINRVALTVPNSYSFQTEGVCMSLDNTVYFTAETSFSGGSALFRLTNNTNSLLVTKQQNFKMYPNPATDIVYIKSDKVSTVEIYSSDFQMVQISQAPSVPLEHLESGCYHVVLRNARGEFLGTQPLLVR